MVTPSYRVAVTNPGLARMGLAPTHHHAAPGAPGGFFSWAFLGPSPLQQGRSVCVVLGGRWGRDGRAWLLLCLLPFPVSSAAASAAGLVQSSGSGRKVAFRGEEREIKI